MDKASFSGLGGVRYGDFVSLFFEPDDGFVCCDGFGNMRAGLARRTIAKDELPNFVDCVFEVVPADNFTDTDEYNKAKAQIFSSQEEDGNNANGDEIDAPATQTQNKDLIDLFAAMKKEIERNKDQRERMHGERVVFGQQIQLRHMMSGLYLGCRGDEGAGGGFDGLGVGLSCGSSACLWRVSPCLKLFSEGDAVDYGDQVILHNERYSRSLSVNNMYAFNSRSSFSSPGEIFLSLLDVVAHSSKRPFRFSPYITFSQRTSLRGAVQCGTVVRLFNQEFGGHVILGRPTQRTQQTQKQTQQQQQQLQQHASGSRLSSRQRLGKTISRELRGTFLPQTQTHTQTTTTTTTTAATSSQPTITATFSSTGENLGGHEQEVASQLVVSSDKSAASTCQGLFLIEFAHNTRSGPATVNDTFRFQHIATGKFLCAGEQQNVTSLGTQIIHTYAITTTSDFEDVGCLFQLRPFFHNAQTHHFIFENSEIHVVNLKTGAVLNVTNDFVMNLTSKAFDESTLRLNPVEEHEIQQVLTVKGIHSNLVPYIEVFQNGDFPPRGSRVAKTTTQALKGLISFATESQAQLLAAEQNTLELLVQMLRAPGLAGVSLANLREPKYFAVFKITRLVYLAIVALATNNPTVAEMAIPFCSLFQQQLGHKLKAADALMCVCTNNTKLLSRVESHLNVVDFVTTIKAIGKFSRYMNFLNALLTCNGVGLPANQNLVLDLLAVKNPQVLVPFKLEGSLVFVRINERWQLFNTFLTEATTQQQKQKQQQQFKPQQLLQDSTTDTEELLNYIERQFAVMANLCVGKNANCVNIVQDMYPYPLLYAAAWGCAYHESQERIRAAVINLIRTAYVDCEPHVPVAVQRFTFNFMSLECDEIETQPVKTRWDLRELMSRLLEFLSENTRLSANRTAHNELILSCLLCVRELCRYGFVAGQLTPSTGVSTKLVSTLVSVLDPNVDVSTVKDETGKYQVRGEGARVMYKCKVAIIEIFQLILTLRHNFILSNLLFYFRGLYEGGHFDSALSPHISDHKKSRVRQMMSKVVPVGSKHKRDDHAKSTELLKTIEFKGEEKVIDVLFDMLAHDHAELVAKTLTFVFDLLQPRKMLLARLDAAQLLDTKDAVEVYNKAIVLRERLAKMLQAGSAQNSDYERAEKCFAELKQLCEDSAANSSSPKPFASYQKIMRDNEIHTMAIKYIGTFDDFTNLSNKLALIAAFSFLTSFCAQNNTNQSVIFPHIDLFLGFMGHGLRVAELMIELVRNNRRIVSLLDEHTARSLVGMIRVGQQHERHLRLIELLVFNHGHPLKRNQDLVMQLMMEKREDVLVLFPGDAGREALAELVAHANASKHNNTLQRKSARTEIPVVSKHDTPTQKSVDRVAYHTGLIRLLSQLCRGLNAATEIVCSTLVDLVDAQAVICTTSFPFSLRGAYLDFVLEVFVCTERSIADIWKNVALWRIVDSMCDVLSLNDTSNMPPQEAEDLLNLKHTTLRLLVELYDRHMGGIKRNHPLFAQPSDGSPPNARAVEMLRITGRVQQILISLHSHSKTNLEHLTLVTKCAQAVVKFPSLSAKQQAELEALGELRPASVALSASQHFFLQPSSESNPVHAAKIMFAKTLREKLVGGSCKPETHSVGKRFAHSGGSLNEFRTKQLIASILEEHVDADQKGEQLSVLQRLTSVTSNEGEFAFDRTAQLWLHNLGATEMIINLLTQDTKKPVVTRSVFEFAISLLDGGNTTIQQYFFATLTTDANSNICSRFFLSLRAQLRDACIEVSERAEHQNKCDAIRSALQEGGGVDQTELEKSMPALEFEGCGKQVMRFIQLLVEGHYRDMQDLLREQHNISSSQDIVSEILGVLHVISRVGVRTSNADILLATLNTLIELCQGPCEPNQKLLVATSLPAICNHVLLAVDIPQDAPMTRRLQHSALQLLLSLLEGTRSREHAERIFSELEVPKIVELMKRTYDEYVVISPINKFGTVIDTCTQEGSMYTLVSRCYILLRTLSEFNVGLKHLCGTYHVEEHALDEMESNLPFARPELCEMWHRLAKYTGKIEIVCGSNLMRLFFPIPKICRNLTEQTMTNTLWAIDRSSPDKKVADFTDAFDDLEAEMKHQERLKTLKPLVLLLRVYKPLQKMIFAIAILVNVVMLLSFGLDGAGQEYLERQSKCNDSPTAAVEWGFEDCDQWLESLDGGFGKSRLRIGAQTSALVSGCAWLLCLLSVMNFSLFAIQYCSLNVQRNLSQFFDGLGKIAAVSGDDTAATPKQTIHKLVVVVMSTYFMISDMKLMFNLSKVAFSVLAITHSPLFLCFHLFSIVEVSGDLQSVLKSVTLNGRSLVVTAIFGALVVYAYAIVGFAFFREHYVQDDGEVLCGDLLQCTVTTLVGGLRKGDVGEILQNTEWASAWFLVWEFSFFVVVITILLNIIFGIIIDTFGELREDNNATEKDMTNCCFICSIDRYTIDRNHSTTGGFAYHTEQDHNLWNYLNFVVYLNQKPVSEFTGPEQHVYECLQREPADCSFYPLNKSISLEDSATSEDEVHELLEKHTNLLEQILELQKQQIEAADTAPPVTPTIIVQQD